MEKRSLRRKLFARIKALSDGEKAACSAALVSRLAVHPAFVRAKTVFSYAPMTSEPDLERLRERFPEKCWGLSRVAENGESLHFHRVTATTALVRNRFGFLEPDPETCPVVAGPELILVPGVGFDPVSGARLGRGKGHYDRFLGPLLARESAPVLIGVCFSVQLLQLAPEPHDIPMTHLATESGIFSPPT